MPLKRDSLLKNLNPFPDKEGILKVVLPANAIISFEQRHPIVLHNKYRLL